jgi:hypothetical protein
MDEWDRFIDIAIENVANFYRKIHGVDGKTFLGLDWGIQPGWAEDKGRGEMTKMGRPTDPTNLLSETLKVLSNYDYTPDDVRWVGSTDGEYAISWAEFAAIADVEYDDGFGSSEIATDLVVVGTDWWLSRGEYDGSEWWEYNVRRGIYHRPERMTDAKGFGIVMGELWPKLAGLNEGYNE